MNDWQIEPDFKESFLDWKKAPGPGTAGGLLTTLDPVLDSAVKTFGQGGGGPLLKSRARRIVLDALPGYDPAKGKLRPFLNSHLQGLRRIATRQADPIHLPERIMLDQVRLHESTGRLRDELGRDPDDLELADETGLSLKRIKAIRAAAPPVAEGQLVAPGEDGEPEPFDPAVRLPGQHHDALALFVYQSLPPAERLIYGHSVGLNGLPVLSTQALARKLRVTPAAVSQRKARIQEKVNAIVGTGMFQ